MKKDCTTCFYAEFKKSASGKRMLDQHGTCNFPPIILPHSYIAGHYSTSGVPERRSITKFTKPDCPCWKKIEKTALLNEEVPKGA